MKNFRVYFNSYSFNEEEKSKIKNDLEEFLIEELKLEKGIHYSVDVSDCIKRTANVDIEIF